MPDGPDRPRSPGPGGRPDQNRPGGPRPDPKRAGDRHPFGPKRAAGARPIGPRPGGKGRGADRAGLPRSPFPTDERPPAGDRPQAGHRPRAVDGSLRSAAPGAPRFSRPEEPGGSPYRDASRTGGPGPSRPPGGRAAGDAAGPAGRRPFGLREERPPFRSPGPGSRAPAGPFAARPPRPFRGPGSRPPGAFRGGDSRPASPRADHPERSGRPVGPGGTPFRPGSRGAEPPFMREDGGRGRPYPSRPRDDDSRGRPGRAAGPSAHRRPGDAHPFAGPPARPTAPGPRPGYPFTGPPPWPGRPTASPPDRLRPTAPDPADLLGEGEELVAGRHPVEEAFLAGRVAHRLIVTPARRDALERLVLHATTLRIPVVEVEGGTLTALAGFDGHQGVALVCTARRPADPAEILARAIERGEPPFVLVLDSLEDPQNLGTLIRSAEAAGVHGAVFPTRRQAPLSPAAVKASAGATEHLLLAPVDDLPGALADLHVRGVRIVGAEAAAPLSYREADLRGPVALVVGSEGSGLAPAVRRRCDLLVRIPMHGRIASLNAAVAGSLLVFEAAAQRGAGPGRGGGRPAPADGSAPGTADRSAPTPAAAAPTPAAAAPAGDGLAADEGGA